MSKHNDKEHDIHDENIPAEENLSNENETTAEGSEEVDEVSKLTAEVQEQKDKYMRLLAEFDNYKRRTAKENMEIRQTAGKDVLISMLEVLDDCDRAEAQIEKDTDIEQVKEGIALVFGKLRKVLTAKGVKEMESIGKDFDPDIQEAITQIPAPTEEMKGKVIDQIKKGYYLNDALIRHAQVIIGQ